ncbi:nuclear transport factor 2 family protein [Actinokineospora sp. UTMC 2448]|uniref:nuclear transport factor 2 family protein n=1 Tax=Actinokineospora sp. UTMC 2448 TaxID=2268449 RepID=UPI00216493E2|nr:nuclear transport factor 2 family protein [Actinokineospora sp. UTMC 2448]UVS80804.1 Ketosteroid isomerase-related protein [Actinokineospora sp. UTMC 2448]
MSTPTTIRDTATTISEFFTRFGAGDRPGMVDLFAPDADFSVPGAPAVPWTGERTTTAAIDEFLRIALEDIATEKFDIDQIIVLGQDGVVLGAFAHRVTATGKFFASRFALHIRVSDGLITRYHMFEDSYRAALAWES